MPLSVANFQSTTIVASTGLLLSLVILTGAETISTTQNPGLPEENVTVIPEVLVPCKHRDEKVAAEKLDSMCLACANYIGREIYKLCSESCYSTKYLPACVKALTYWNEKDAYRQWVEKLSGNEFAVWTSAEVVVVEVASTTMEVPEDRSNETRSTTVVVKEEGTA